MNNGNPKEAVNAQPNSELDDLIYQIAEYNRDEDVMQFYKLLRKSEIFSSIEKRSHLNEDKIQFPYTLVNNNKLVMFYTQPDDPRLSRPYAGMPGNKALEMVLKVAEVDGMIIQSHKRDAWFAMTKPQIANILEHYQ